MLTQAMRKIVPTFNMTTPDRAELLQALEETKFTPDVAKLCEYEWQLFFAPDELKKDHLQHHLLGEECEYVFPAFTQKGYHFWDRENDPLTSPIPMVTSEQNLHPWFPPVAKIKGEVYLIRPQRFYLGLDRYRQNTVEYRRERVRLIVPYRKVEWLKDHNLDPAFGVQEAFARSEYTGKSIKTSNEMVYIIRAWMYIGVPQYWDPLISLYDYTPVETFHSRNRRWCDQYYNIRRPALPK